MMISVVMSAYNSETYLSEAIESILHQDYKEFEFIIINDGSTDNTGDILKSYDDKRIRIIDNENNIGLTRSLIKGIENAEGKYIARMDSDDIAKEDRFTTQIDFLENNTNVDICGTWAMAIDEAGKFKYHIKTPIRDNQIKEMLVFGNCIVHPSVMIRSDVFKKVCYDPTFKSCQDYKLWADCKNTYVFHNLNKELMKYRINSSGISQTEQGKSLSRYQTLKRVYKQLIHERFSKLCVEDEELLMKCFSQLFELDKKETMRIYALLTSFEDISKEEKNEFCRLVFHSTKVQNVGIGELGKYLLGAGREIMCKMKAIV